MVSRILPLLALIALYVYVLVDLSRAPSSEVRLLPKWLWVIVVVVLFLFGPLLWLVLGRPRAVPPQSGGEGGGGSSGRRPGPRGPVAPDDDPEFLKRLDEQSWSTKMERLRREREAGGGQPPPAGEGPGPGSDEADHSGA